MLILVLGEEKNGKSWYSETLCQKLKSGGLYYLATFIPVGGGETGASRIARHRAHREGAGFTTLEVPHGLRKLSFKPDDLVLLEDITNLLANYMFCDGVNGGTGDVVADVEYLAGCCENVIAVALTGLEESPEYDAETNAYVRAHLDVNNRLYELADAVVVIEKTIPRILKGEGLLPNPSL